MTSKSENQNQLSVTDLRVVRGDNTLLDSVSFSAAGGDMIWISGENGIGKTSLLKCLAGLLRPGKGEILWGGNTPRHADRLIGFHSHNDGLKSNLTVEENLEFWHSIYGQNVDLKETMVRLDISDLKQLKARQLSAGQSRRVALARLVLKDAPYWLLDEPGAPMDEDGRAIISELLTDHLARSGIAILASHRLPDRIGNNTRHMILNRSENA